MTTFTRYYLSEIIKIFFILLTILYIGTVSLQFYNITPIIEETNITFSEVVGIILLQYPHAINLMTMTCFSFAVFFTTSNFSQSSEIISARSLGYSYNRLFTGAGGLGLVVGILLSINAFFLMPDAFYVLAIKKQHILTTRAKLKLMPGSIHLVNNNLFFFEKLADGKMNNIFIKPALDNPFFNAEKKLIWSRALDIQYLQDRMPSIVLLDGAYLGFGLSSTHYSKFEQLKIPLLMAYGNPLLGDFYTNDQISADNLQQLKHKNVDFWSVSDIYLALSRLDVSDPLFYSALVEFLKKTEGLSIAIAIALMAATLGISRPRSRGGSEFKVVLLFLLTGLQSQIHFNILKRANSVSILISSYIAQLVLFYLLATLLVYITNRDITSSRLLNLMYKLKSRLLIFYRKIRF